MCSACAKVGLFGEEVYPGTIQRLPEQECLTRRRGGAKKRKRDGLCFFAPSREALSCSLPHATHLGC